MKEFIPPVTFTLILQHKQKEALTKVVKWLMSDNGSHPFQWEMLDVGRWQLTIESSWAFNLKQIAKILLKYKEKKNK